MMFKVGMSWNSHCHFPGAESQRLCLPYSAEALALGLGLSLPSSLPVESPGVSRAGCRLGSKE